LRISITALWKFVSTANNFSFWWCALASSFTWPNSYQLFLRGYLKWKVYSRQPDFSKPELRIWVEKQTFHKKHYGKW
jgi:hypothetical protein